MFAATAPTNSDPFTPTDWSLFWAMGLMWGSSFLLIDVALEAFAPGVITLGRVGLGALTLRLFRSSGDPIAAGDRGRIVVLSLVWVAVPFTLFPLAEEHINSAVTGLLNGGTPIFAALVATLLVRRPPSRRQAGGIGLGFIGIVAMSVPSIQDGSSQALGVAMVVTATICYGFAINIAAPLQARYGSVVLMARVLSVATIITAPYGLIGLADSKFTWTATMAVAVLGMVGTGVAFGVMATLVGRVGSTRASLITYLIPVMALGLGVAFRSDHVSALALVGVTLVLAGAFRASRD